MHKGNTMAKKTPPDRTTRVANALAAVNRNVRTETARDAVKPKTSTTIKPRSGGVSVTRTTRF